MRAVLRPGVSGPDQARVAAHNIHALANRVYQSWVTWEQAMTAGISTDRFEADFRTYQRDLHVPSLEFLTTAARALREPEEAL